MADNISTPNNETTPPNEVASEVDSKATEKQDQKLTNKKEEKVEAPKQPEQPEAENEKNEDKQVEKDSEDNGEEPENKSISKRMTKAELIAELDDMKEDMETLNAKILEKDEAYNQLKVEAESYKALIKEMEQASENYKTLLSEIVEAKKNSIPKEIQDLLPDGTLEQQLAWLNKAEQSGLGIVKKDKPVVEIGKPMNMGVPQADTSKMTPQQKLSSYFAQVFTK